MPRIIHILTHEYPPYRGGAGTYCYEMALSASKLGENIKVWAPHGSEKNSFFKITELPWKGSQSLLSSYKLIKKVRNFIKESRNENIFHIAELGSSRAFLRFGWMLPVQTELLLTIHGSEILRFTKNPLEKWLFRKLLIRCKKIHVLSLFNFKKLIKFCPQAKPHTLRIPGAASSSLSNSKTNFKSSKEDYKVRILCVGRLHPRKGQDQLLQAIHKLDRDIQKNLEVIFAGPPIKTRYAKKLENLRNESESNVVFKGDCSENQLIDLYNKSDLFCLTSMPRANSVEGFGFVYLEASSYKLPIIANRTGGVEDTVLENETGILCDPGNINQLSKAIKLLVEDSELRQKLGARGKEWALKHRWELAAKELYQGL